MYRRDTQAAAVKQAARLRSLQAALGMFTVIPVPATELGKDAAGRAILWLPATGLLITMPAAAGLLAIEAGGGSTPRRLLAATVAILVLALVSGGLHLDGLADTADGLASRRPPPEALAIMRRGDAGPLGVAALLLVLLLQITSLAALPAGLPGAAALATATVTARVAVVLATGPRVPAARPDGFGALVAGATTAPARAAQAALLVTAVTAGGGLAGGLPLAGRALAAVAAGLLTAATLCRAARLRLGGLTGDVFGAVIEVATAATLLVLAASA